MRKSTVFATVDTELTVSNIHSKQMPFLVTNNALKTCKVWQAFLAFIQVF